MDMVEIVEVGISPTHKCPVGYLDKIQTNAMNATSYCIYITATTTLVWAFKGIGWSLTSIFPSNMMGKRFAHVFDD